MNDSYIEQVVKKKRTSMDKMKQIALLALVLVFAIVTLVVTIGMKNIAIQMVCWVPELILLFVANYLISLVDVEYEYLFVSGELSIDKIFAKRKRKAAYKVTMDQIEIMAPKQSPALDTYRKQTGKVMDYTSGREDKKIYVCIVKKGQNVEKIYFEPKEELVEMMRRMSPRKVLEW